MSKSVNMVVLIGNVGSDPEIRVASNGTKFATLQVATTRSWVDNASGQRKSETEWHSIITYMNGLVNILENYVKKGAKLYVRGRIKTSTWTDKDGNKRYDKKILLDGFDSELVLLDKMDRNTQSVNENNDDFFNNDINIDNEDPSDDVF